MEKTRINLNILLPELPGERDECVNRIIRALESRRGIDRVHVIPASENKKAQLCFHYDSSEHSVNEIEQLARKAGAEITEHYGHLLINVSGIRHPRHGYLLEETIKTEPGIQSVSVSGTGFIQLEYHKDQLSREQVLQRIDRLGLKVNEVTDFHSQFQAQPDDDQHRQQDHSGQEADTVHDHNGAAHAHDHSGSSKAKHSSGTAHDPAHAGGSHGHNHTHGGIFGERTELIFSVICGIFLGIGFGLSFIRSISFSIPLVFYLLAYLAGGFYTGKEAIEGITRGHFEIDFLMLVAAIGAAALSQWAEGALLLFLFSLGHSLEHYAMEKARKSIASLAELTPKKALLKTGDELNEVGIEVLKAGDIIVVKPNSKIAADGIVINGNSSVDQSPVTGESIPVEKTAIENPAISNETAEKSDDKYRVFAGTINGSGTLEIRVTRPATDSTIARLVNLVNEAQTQKSPTQNFADKLEKYYVPAVLSLVVLLLFAFLVRDEPFSASFYRAMAVLVAASPCALAISTPSAVLSGVARAAKAGVLIKGGRPLEELGSLTAIAFDKTGTLTEGKPKLTGIYPLNGCSREELLEIIIAVEKLSDHPLAAAIVRGGQEQFKKEIKPASAARAIAGRGISAKYEDSDIYIGNKEMFQDAGDQFPEQLQSRVEELEAKGNTTMMAKRNQEFVGIITLMDIARKDAKATLRNLTGAGIKKMIMLTGDNQKVADAIALEIGITEAWGNLLPEQKVAAIEKLRTSEKKVAMVGDGVNDAPAMAKSTVGIAMGAAGSDVALETADIALMADRLDNLPFAIGLSRKARSIIRQNLIISLGMVAVLVPLTIFGIAHIGPAVIGHEGSTIVVVFNALRLLAYKPAAPAGPIVSALNPG